MKLLLALGLNILLVGALGLWFRKQRQTPQIGHLVLPALGLKLVASGLAWVMLSGDAAYFQRWGLLLTAQLWAEPMTWLRMLFSEEFHASHKQLVFHGYSNTFFIMKVLSVLNLASGGSALLNGVYLSLFSFVGGWQLAKAVGRAFPATPPWAAVVAFLGWPTVVYWTAGLTKESLLVGSAAWLLALVLNWLYAQVPVRASGVLGAVLLVGLQFKMRFFFAVIFFAALAALVLIRVGQHVGGLRRRWTQVGVVVLVLSAGALVAREISPVFRFNKFTSQLIRNYSELHESSRHRPHIEYADLAPTLESILRNTPHAISSAILRPWPWESSNLVYVAAGLENLLLLLVLGVAAAATLRGKAGRLPFALVLALLVYGLLLAALLGLSTPNLGTLNRYRVALLPFLLLLALQNDYVAPWLRRFGR